jgi:hypothetical protein
MGHIHLYGKGNMSDRIGPGKILPAFRERGKAHYRDEEQQDQSGSGEYPRQELPVNGRTSRMRFVLQMFRRKPVRKPSIYSDALFRSTLKSYGYWDSQIKDSDAFQRPLWKRASRSGGNLARWAEFELEPECGRERSGSPQAKSRAERGISLRIAREWLPGLDSN